MKKLEYRVDDNSLLLEYLINNIKDSKNNIKSYLKNGYIYVNDECITKYDYKLKPNDLVNIKFKTKELDILYEDNNIIIINKECGLLTISTDKSNNSLYRKVSSYVKKNNKNNKIFIVNRLDKDTSGIVVFAKNEKTKKMLQEKWNDIVSVRKYIAIVEGITEEKGEIKSYLEEKDTYVYSSNKGKLAITKYEKIKNNANYSLLNIYLLTGRKNQIRVHMKDINHNVVGDKKYGSKTKDKLMLHCIELKFTNPIDNREIDIQTDYPDRFKKYFN